MIRFTLSLLSAQASWVDVQTGRGVTIQRADGIVTGNVTLCAEAWKPVPEYIVQPVVTIQPGPRMIVSGGTNTVTMTVRDDLCLDRHGVPRSVVTSDQLEAQSHTLATRDDLEAVRRDLHQRTVGDLILCMVLLVVIGIVWDQLRMRAQLRKKGFFE